MSKTWFRCKKTRRSYKSNKVVHYIVSEGAAHQIYFNYYWNPSQSSAHIVNRILNVFLTHVKLRLIGGDFIFFLYCRQQAKTQIMQQASSLKTWRDQKSHAFARKYTHNLFLFQRIFIHWIAAWDFKVLRE